MPVYSYRREDGTTFDIKQKFLDDPLEVCPTTGQKVIRIVQAAGIIFKGSGFYVTDNKGSANGRSNGHKSSDEGSSNETSNGVEAKSETKPEPRSDAKSETKTEAKSPPKAETTAAP